MNTQVTTLSNGLRVASHRMDHLETVSLGVWVAAGARHESDAQHGLSHLLEHMAFKGTATRTAQRIAEEIEEVGGELNAATGLDMTSYFARVLKGDDGVALEILADILLNSAFHADELNKEREVILQEIAGAQDDPEDLAYDLLQKTAFPDQGIGRPILGTRDSVTALQAADLMQYLADRYRPGAMVISAAGAINHDRLVRHVEALFGGLTPSASGDAAAARYVGGAAAGGKPFEQSHLLIGFPAPSVTDQNFCAAQVFSGLFGGGMSSRLFQEVRENRGLCYSIYSTAWGLKDAGMLAVHAAMSAQMVEKVASVVAAELDALASTGPTSAELQRAKAQLKAGLMMALESSTIRAEQMARQLLIYNRILPPPELAGQVDEVSVSDVRHVAANLTLETASIAVVGSGRKSAAQAKRVADIFASGGDRLRAAAG
ncbi:MAG: M16 family metallopeptidase [Hyphomicrobium sp.]